VEGFKALPGLYPIVALTAAIGARRNEVLAFRWTDFDPGKKTIRVERALEVTKKFGTRLKPPKTWRGLRTVALDDGSVSLLLQLRETHLRLRAGVPDGVEVDLSLVRLPDDALIFPNPPGPGEDFSFSVPRLPQSFSVQFAKRAAKLGFPDFHYHHLRGTHSTLLLDRGVPVHIVAERIGDDPSVLLKNYAKRKREQTADTSVSAVISALAAGFLRP
jgi:integrase